ncbi:MAG: YceI family protein [Gramella sp.]|nr:YceI family protein [Christiangramia sp.]
MKRLFMIVAAFMLSVSLKAQKDFEIEIIRVLPESELTIIGSTNVNTFTCRFNIAQITGRYTVSYTGENQYIKFKDLALNLQIDAFDCGNRKMNSDFQDLLRGDKYPHICIAIDRIEPFSKEYTKAFISVSLAGKEKHYDLPVNTIDNSLIGKFKINIRDFGLEPPKKALGLIEVDEMIEIYFDLKLLILNKSTDLPKF